MASTDLRGILSFSSEVNNYTSESDFAHVLIFLPSGIALSRIGLWSFDLCQVNHSIQSLSNHSNRSSL